MIQLAPIRANRQDELRLLCLDQAAHPDLEIRDGPMLVDRIALITLLPIREGENDPNPNAWTQSSIVSRWSLATSSRR
jgi:hypothetical protein